MSDDIDVRQATVADIPEPVRLRRVMFEARGFDNPAQLVESGTLHAASAGRPTMRDRTLDGY